MKGIRTTIPVGAALMALAVGALANPPGDQLQLFDGGGANAHALFSVDATDHSRLNVDANWLSGATWTIKTLTGSSSNGGQLLGIREIFLVDVSSGSPLPGPAAIDPDLLGNSPGGYVKLTSSSTQKSAWAVAPDKSYITSNDVGNNGFGSGANFMVTGQTAGVNGISPDNNYMFGSFAFSDGSTGFSLLDNHGNLKYDIGIDYLVKTGATTSVTHTGYFIPPDGGGGFPDNVPEPIFFQMGAMVGLGGLGLFRMRRNRTAATA